MRLICKLASALASVATLANAGGDKHTDFVQTCLENGFDAESYTVFSEDGYVYQLYRIPGMNGEAPSQKPAVLMMHGIECDMNFWTPNVADVAPPFVLASQGYDVWLGNNRGSRFAKYHTTLSPSDEEYWHFSQEEMGRRDLPTFIDYILETTGQEQLTYVGHSQGTTQMFMAASLDPDYFSEKVNLFVALGPVTNLSNVKVPALRALSKDWREVEYLALKAGVYNLLDFGWYEETGIQLFCDALPVACDDLVAYMADSNPEVDNMDRFDVFLKDFPAGNGYGNLVYYAQSIQDPETWHRRNFGAIRNMDVYGTAIAPEVPLDQLSLPTALFVGSYDNLATVEDNEWLVTKLNPETLIWHEIYPLGHLSFSLAKDMSFFTEDAMALINQYATNVASQTETPEILTS